jgi:hypothetical protein
MIHHLVADLIKRLKATVEEVDARLQEKGLRLFLLQEETHYLIGRLVVRKAEPYSEWSAEDEPAGGRECPDRWPLFPLTGYHHNAHMSSFELETLKPTPGQSSA